MAQQTTWRATVTYPQPDAEFTDEVIDALGSVGGFAIAEGDGERLRLSTTIEAATLRQAAEAALRATRAAYAAAFGAASEASELQVLTLEEHLERLASPATLDLVSVGDVAAMLGVTRQRADELIRTHPDFPAHVGAIGGKRAFTRTSIEEFDKRWDRKRTGRPRKDA
jgi:hypothetical protein